MARPRRRPEPESEPIAVELGDLRLHDFVDPRELLNLSPAEGAELAGLLDDDARLVWLGERYPDWVCTEEEARRQRESLALSARLRDARRAARRRGHPMPDPADVFDGFEAV